MFITIFIFMQNKCSSLSLAITNLLLRIVIRRRAIVGLTLSINLIFLSCTVCTFKQVIRCPGSTRRGLLLKHWWRRRGLWINWRILAASILWHFSYVISFIWAILIISLFFKSAWLYRHRICLFQIWRFDQLLLVGILLFGLHFILLWLEYMLRLHYGKLLLAWGEGFCVEKRQAHIIGTLPKLGCQSSAPCAWACIAFLLGRDPGVCRSRYCVICRFMCGLLSHIVL